MKEDIYGEPEVLVFGNVIVTVHSPILTEEERKKRLERVKQATIRLVLSTNEVNNDK